MKHKTIIIILSILILITGIVLIILLLNRNNDNNEYENLITEEEVILNRNSIEVYEKVNLSQLLTFKDGLNLVEDYLIDTNTLGMKKLNIVYNDEVTGKEKKGYVEINIIDTTPPYIGVGDHYSHILNTNFTFYSDVICKDNYDRKVKCEIEGEYNPLELGEYKVKVLATDSSGNKTEKDIILKVIEKKDVKSSTTYKKVEDIVVPDNASLMIDVSKWQADIDWKKVKDSGIDYVMMRLGTQKAVDKESVLDTYFEKNIKGAQSAGIKVGVYYFSYANDVEDARIQAEWVVEQLKDYKLDLPVSFDWECWKYLNDFEINLHEFNEMGRTFLKIVKENGYDVLNYGSKSYLENIWDIDEYDTWLAHYTDKTTYSKDYIMWQFTDKGKVPGINGAVDLNFYYNK